MKRFLVIAVLAAAVSQQALAMNTKGGIQLKCKSNQYLYKGANGVLSCVNTGSFGATAPKSKPALIGGNGGLHILPTKGGIQVNCPAGQRTYVGAGGRVSCIGNNLLGATAPVPGRGGSGEQVSCGANQQRYVGANGHLSCIAKGSMGAMRNTGRMTGNSGGSF